MKLYWDKSQKRFGDMPTKESRSRSRHNVQNLPGDLEFIGDVTTCLTCGALVLDHKLHAKFHKHHK